VTVGVFALRLLRYFLVDLLLVGVDWPSQRDMPSRMKPAEQGILGANQNESQLADWPPTAP
jgi:hypothetical protein